MTPKLSSYWLYFVTSTSYKLAMNLVDSMKMEVVAQDNRLQEMLGIETHTYEEAIDLAFKKIEQNLVISSWKDSIASGQIKEDLNEYIQVPKYGVLQDKKSIRIKDEDAVLNNIWRIGGETGWYYGNWLWKIRGFLDKLVGGPGLRRGRTHPYRLFPGDALDFWRVLLADKKINVCFFLPKCELRVRLGSSLRLRTEYFIKPQPFVPKAYWDDCTGIPCCPSTFLFLGI